VGCPFVIGGGLVRDAILGGRPSDIDIWLPSNLANGLADLGTFASRLQDTYPGAQVNAIFSGPGANVTPIEELLAEPTSGEYGDVNNHWVVEMQVEGWPRVNFMRSMTPWTAPQAFFNGLMRAFDIDYCMFFIGWMPGQNNVNTVIMPEHMTNRAINNPRMNEIYWNQYRLSNTSAARVESRLIKMYSKYSFRMRCPEEFEREGLILPTESIRAKPMLLSRAMRMLTHPSSPIHPTYHNSYEVSDSVWNSSVNTIRDRYNNNKQRVLNAITGTVGAQAVRFN
jgi:hypothetical protein